MKRFALLLTLCVCTVVLAGCAPSQETSLGDTVDLTATPMPTTTTSATASATPSSTPSAQPTAGKKTASAKVKKQLVTIETDKGTIEMELYPDKAPETVKRFIEKVKSGFYNGLVFHRSDYMVIQGGDPLGTGTGGGQAPSEYNDLPFIAGSLGIARGGDKAINNDSQFFICKNDSDCDHLQNEYTNFGKVTKGIDVVNAILKGDKMSKLTYEEK